MSKIYAGIEASVGEFRKFSFSTDDYEVKEIIHNPNFFIDWTWQTGVCTHCKRTQERTVRHEFYRIEILAKENATNVAKADLVLLGDTLDKRKMQIPFEHYDSVLVKSNIYKALILEGN